MTAELGHFLLILAAVTATLAPMVVLYGIWRREPFFGSFWRFSTPVVFLTLAGAALCLVYAFVTDDFSVAYVANNSNRSLALVYKIAALWGSHEGSLLLWIVLIAAWMLLWALPRAALPECAPVQAVMTAIIAALTLFLVLTSNPFVRLLPLVPPDGRDLNPILQDIGMVMHPPVLFMGYAGLCLCFALATARLMQTPRTADPLLGLRIPVLVTWGFLTAGNALGSWWAYNELGWGGWWFWDPVENASFIPWLAVTALVHALWLGNRRGQLRASTLLLCLIGFALCLLGSFLVRSGVVQSVHAFATAPARGTALLALALVLLVPAFGLYARRIDRMFAPDERSLTASDAVITLGVYVILAAAASVLIGTLYPLFYAMLGAGQLTVGAPYFNTVFVPMTLLVAVLMGCAHLQAARAGWQRWTVCLAGAGVMALAAVTLTEPKQILTTACSVFCIGWIAVTLLTGWLSDHRPSAAATLAHLGLAVSMAGALGVAQYESEALVRMGPGLSRPLSDVVFAYEATEPVETNAYEAQQGRILVMRPDQTVLTVLLPERQTFKANGMQVSAAGIEHGLWRDLYVSMGNAFDDGQWLVRLSIKPLASWIWSGGVLMIFGAVWAVLVRPRRRRENA